MSVLLRCCLQKRFTKSGFPTRWHFNMGMIFMSFVFFVLTMVTWRQPPDVNRYVGRFQQCCYISYKYKFINICTHLVNTLNMHACVQCICTHHVHVHVHSNEHAYIIKLLFVHVVSELRVIMSYLLNISSSFVLFQSEFR